MGLNAFIVEHSGRRIVLASGSPRRWQLLTAAGYDVVVNAVDADESWPEGSIEHGLLTICHRKLAHAGPYVYPTVAADTVVTLDEQCFGKPRDTSDAHQMLQTLSGREHVVMTGWCVRYHDSERAAVAHTRVVFRKLTELEITRYIGTGEPFDKAGGYGIQGEGAALVESLSGPYTNVVGLPLSEVRRAIEELVGP